MLKLAQILKMVKKIIFIGFGEMSEDLVRVKQIEVDGD